MQGDPPANIDVAEASAAAPASPIAALDEEAARRRAQTLSEPYALRLPAAEAYSGMSRAGIYRAIAAGELEIKKDGRTTLIVFASLKRRMENLPRRKTAA